ncbi:MAG TPA: hypothetical protein VFK32_07015 [Tepidiformaceae bacterium]|nr:hypothetical protein [Tepidiformaceae bacterium]
MNGDGTPFMLLRARPKPGAREAFDHWFRTVHLVDVRKIPGVVRATGGWTSGGTRLGFYYFADAEAVGSALESPEAAYARGTWSQWAVNLEELGVEIMAPLVTLPMYEATS